MLKEGTMGDLPEVARWVLEKVNSKVLLFHGDMGSGKTTLIKELCHQLGVQDEVSSPTFSLVNEYLGREGPVYHFDFYRIEDEEEAYEFGLEEYLDSEHWCLLEWPQKISNLLPNDHQVVEIETTEDGRLYRINQPNV